MRDKFALRRLTYDYQLCTEDQIAFFISLVSCTLHEFFLSFVLLRRFIVFFYYGDFVLLRFNFVYIYTFCCYQNIQKTFRYKKKKIKITKKMTDSDRTGLLEELSNIDQSQVSNRHQQSAFFFFCFLQTQNKIISLEDFVSTKNKFCYFLIQKYVIRSAKFGLDFTAWVQVKFLLKIRTQRKLIQSIVQDETGNNAKCYVMTIHDLGCSRMINQEIF